MDALAQKNMGCSLREEDPGRRNLFSFGLHAEISVRLITKWRRKRENLELNARLRPCSFSFP